MTSDCASCPFKEKKEENDKDKKAHARYDARQHAMFASTPGVVSTNTQECCAERMLIRAVEQQLRRRGVRTERSSLRHGVALPRGRHGGVLVTVPQLPVRSRAVG